MKLQFSVLRVNTKVIANGIFLWKCLMDSSLTNNLEH